MWHHGGCQSLLSMGSCAKNGTNKQTASSDDSVFTSGKKISGNKKQELKAKGVW